MKIKEAWFEVIPTACGDSYAMSDYGVYIHQSKAEVESEIESLASTYREQAAAGERDEDDCEVDSYPLKVYLTETGSVLSAPTRKQSNWLPTTMAAT